VGPASEWDIQDEQLELRLRRFGIPVALAVTWLLVKSGAGHFVVRIFCSMWIHELGHATAAWLCGYPALPVPWLTLTADSRSPLLVVVLLGGLAVGAFRLWRSERRLLAAGFAGAGAVQLACTLVLPADRAQQLIVFAGDGGAIFIGTLLMLTLYAPEGSAFRREWLRWGFLGIGAASFADVFEQWWSARHDPDQIPFGMNEGAGLSDPSRLSEEFGWTADQIVNRYVALGCLCLVVLTIAWVRGAVSRQQVPAAGIEH
jgi:hypothetical protein